MIDGDIIWEDPPASTGVKGVWFARLAPLMEHPKRWANLGEHAGAMAGHLTMSAKGARLYSVPPGQWEFTSRSMGCPKGRAILYARYLGPEDEG